MAKIIGQIVLEDGTRKDVIGQNGRFYLCEDSQHLKGRYILEPAQKAAPKRKKPEEQEP